MRSILAAIVLAPIAVVGFGCANDYLLQRQFNAVSREEPESEILRIFGRPEKVTDSPMHVAWGGDPVHPNSGVCVKEFWYRPVVNLVDEAYAIGFDANGRVVSKYHYISQ